MLQYISIYIYIYIYIITNFSELDVVGPPWEVSTCACVCVWFTVFGLTRRTWRGLAGGLRGYWRGYGVEESISRGPDCQCVVMVGAGMAGYLLLQPPSLQHVVGDWHGIGLLVGISYKLSDFSGWNSINA